MKSVGVAHRGSLQPLPQKPQAMSPELSAGGSSHLAIVTAPILHMRKLRDGQVDCLRTTATGQPPRLPAGRGKNVQKDCGLAAVQGLAGLGRDCGCRLGSRPLGDSPDTQDESWVIQGEDCVLNIPSQIGKLRPLSAGHTCNLLLFSLGLSHFS
jgi:hypothetical protein